MLNVNVSSDDLSLILGFVFAPKFKLLDLCNLILFAVVLLFNLSNVLRLEVLLRGTSGLISDKALSSEV